MPETWYVEVAGQELGPISAAGLRREAQAGRLTPAVRVRRGKDGVWVVAGKVRGLFSDAPPQPQEMAAGGMTNDEGRITRVEGETEASEVKAPISDLKSQISEPKSESSDLETQNPKSESEIVNLTSEIPAVAVSAEPGKQSEIANLESNVPDLKSEVTQPPDADGPEVRPTVSRWRRVARQAAAPWSVSLVTHALLLLVLGFWLVPMIAEGRGEMRVLLNSSSDSAIADLASAASSPSAARADSEATFATAAINQVSADAPLLDTPPLRVDMAELASVDMPAFSGDMLRGLGSGQLGTESSMIPPRAAQEGGVTSAEGVGSALDGILGGIEGQLSEGNLLVVWLLDASISLVDDRAQIAARLEPFYQNIGIRDKKTQSVFSNAVVAFGNRTQELVKPTHFNGKIVRAVQSVPIDETGVENVMTAVEQCVHKYRGKWKDDILIVIWTDESGDDILRLENTIRLCREQRVVVTVVGPSAVLGSERGSHHYTDPGSGFSFLLPVKRGPDTSLPERMMIPYWHASMFNPWQQDGAVVAQGVKPFGGPHRERLLSGFGPYALTRLALQTGGTFTLLDRPADRGPFDLHKLRDYLPDYGSAEDYVYETQAHPLRRAVSSAVMRTFNDAFSQPPQMGFFGSGAVRYPYGVSAMYMPPSRFRDRIGQVLPQEERRVAAALRIIEQALADFDDKTDYEELYQEEYSQRWRAWYNLTRGRLLANSVRYQEYLLACQMVRRGLNGNQETNFVAFYPAEELISKGSTPRMTEAGRLLNRCIEDNPSTPWALLAQWELEHALGLRIESAVIPMPPPNFNLPGISGGGVGGGGVSLPKL